MIRPSIPFLRLAMLALPVLAQPDGGEEQPPVQRNPQVGESRSDTSPPLRDIPPAPRQPGHRVHEVKPVPRPRPQPPPPRETTGSETEQDGGTD